MGPTMCVAPTGSIQAGGQGEGCWAVAVPMRPKHSSTPTNIRIVRGLGEIRGLTFKQERFPVSCFEYCLMRRSWTPSIVPNGHDQTFHLVINNYGQSGTAFAETDVGEADLETVISDLMSGSTATRFASSRLTPLNVGLRMPRRMLRGKLCAVSISPGMSCRHQHGHSLTAISVRTVN